MLYRVCEKVVIAWSALSGFVGVFFALRLLRARRMCYALEFVKCDDHRFLRATHHVHWVSVMFCGACFIF